MSRHDPAPCRVLVSGIRLVLIRMRVRLLWHDPVKLVERQPARVRPPMQPVRMILDGPIEEDPGDVFVALRHAVGGKHSMRQTTAASESQACCATPGARGE